MAVNLVNLDKSQVARVGTSVVGGHPAHSGRLGKSTDTSQQLQRQQMELKSELETQKESRRMCLAADFMGNDGNL